MRSCACIVLPLALGCDVDATETDPQPTGECAAGEWRRDDGRCVAPGLPPDLPCPPGEWLRDAQCIPAGVPSDGCGEGFAHDMDRGCEPILPPQDCADGLLAVPGETRCREVAPCAAGVFGDIPVEPDTEYVDASHSGTSDGSQAAPWTTIQAAVDAALPGAIIAVAAGNYTEDVVVQYKPVRLWGKCPSLVQLTGSGFAALLIGSDASGTEVRRFSITGQAHAVAASGSEDVLLDEVWLHDTGDRALFTQNDYGPTSLALTRSLLERNSLGSVLVGGAAVTIEATVVRDNVTDAQGFRGRGIVVQDSEPTPARANVTIVRSIVERNHDAGVMTIGSDVVVESCVVRDTLPDADGFFGHGIIAQENDTTGERANVTVVRSIVERHHTSGMFIAGADATVEATVVRDNLPAPDGLYGRGVMVVDDPATGAPASVAVLFSLIERNHEVGLVAFGSETTVDATAVRNTLTGTPIIAAGGISALSNPITGRRTRLVVGRSLLEGHPDFGVAVQASDATVEATVIRDPHSVDDNDYGRAIQVQSDPDTGANATAMIHASLMERSFRSALAVMGPATAEIDACLVSITSATHSGYFGDGLVVWSMDGPASAVVTGTRIEQSQRAALSNFGATVTLQDSLLACQGFDLAAEPWDGPAIYEDRGGVRCGCPEATEPCKAQSYALEPPPPQ